MAAESEIQEFFEKAGCGAAGYHTVMRDGTVEAIGREAVKDVRNTLFEVFFGRGERCPEPGAPLNPLFHDIVQGRKEHGAAMTLPPSPADLVERSGPAALLQDQQQSQGQGISM